MFQRVLLTGIAAGLVAGIVLSGLQTGAVTPLILAAETYETGAGGPGALPHPHGDGIRSHPPGDRAHEPDGHAVASHHHGAAWSPEDGIERVAWTAVSNIATAIGFALLLAAIFAWRGSATWRQGLLWGVAGFVVFFANPAIGLRPEVPGAFAADLLDRQWWWLLTVVCSAAGVGLLLLAPRKMAKIGGAALLFLPHLAGAPHPDATGGLAPQALADRFVIAAAVTNGAFWIVLGLASAVAFRRFAHR